MSRKKPPPHSPPEGGPAESPDRPTAAGEPERRPDRSEPGGPPPDGQEAGKPQEAGPPAPRTLRQRLKAYHVHTRGAFTGFLMGFPLALVYYICVLAGIEHADRDFFVKLQIDVVGETAYIFIQGALVLTFFTLIFVLQRRGRFEARYFGPLVVESLGYAIAAVAVVSAAMAACDLEPAYPPLDNRYFALASALGEAINEETFFRWITLELLVWLMVRKGQMKWILAAALSLVLATLLYASVGTFLGPAPPAGSAGLPARFLTLMLAGAWFGALYLARGYTVCAYTHLFYATFWVGIKPYLGA